MSGVLDWLMFQRVFGYGTVRAQKLLEVVTHPTELLELPIDRLATLGALLPRELAMLTARTALVTECQRSLDGAYKLGAAVITPDSDSYPQPLRDIYSPPSVLYLLGSLAQYPNQPAIGMVGTRQHTDYGRQAADDIAFDLARRGVTVVSGLAAGIDTISHRAALRASGYTIAVLGCGIDTIYPLSNIDLHSAIVSSGGAVITEFALGEKPLPFHFPIRNRIVSALSLGVVVVEGSRRSGSLITAGHAVTQGHEIFAVPGSIYSRMSQATNWLITQGATMVSCADDIMGQFPYLAASHPPKQTDKPAKKSPPVQISFDIPANDVYNDTIPSYLSDNQRRVLQVIARDPTTADAIAIDSEVALPQVLACLTQLEIFGLIEATAGRRFMRKQ